MTTESGYRRGGIARIITILVVLWLIIGAVAAGQRGYYSSSGKGSCAKTTTTVVTIVAGPLNYLGVNPKENCPNVPQPSK
ncbi:MAG TPA: hypothetical protein VGN18_04110 [Jatrophihabitans sp.]|uniref:hypothetical protein n=1 Tax=Jatrophihabitans sp. TaxID=1932789 RepID=UPI002DFD635D|nr:hypothetical protein [Jatrophihabitans sp.]